MRILLTAFVAALLGATAASADTAPFDLAGPALRVTVTHQGATLPIAEVPQLATGDTIAIVPDLPDDQSAHYILVAGFLRGSTNPPPDKWFFQADTWTKKGRKGLSLTVPEGAQQVMLFLAPETGGDYPTLRNAVQGRPGAFVRAAQDLAQASLDHARLATYLAAVRKEVPGDPGRLDRVTPLLARSLQVKINADCLTKLPEQQAPCLLQNQESLVLSDGHSNAITDAMQGPGADLALQLAATPQGGLGFYSPYIGAIRDIIGIFSSFHTAKYQYIPALATLDGDRMGLMLNTPPSFHNPKSVLVTALPVIAPVHIPPLQTVEPSPALCAQAPAPVLPMGGAPLIYATRYAHDLVLRAKLPDGRTVDLPATPDAEQGGLVIHTDRQLAGLQAPVDATLHGIWGFQPFDGPRVRLRPARSGQWRLPQGAARAATMTLTGGTSACVGGVTARGQAIDWKQTAPDAITVTLPASVGKDALSLAVAGPAGSSPDQVAIPAVPPPLRFGASLIAHSIQRPAAPAPLPIVLDGDQAVPADATLTFSLRADKGLQFSGRETIEVAAMGGGGTAALAPGSGLTLADPQVAVATLVPATALGSSAFGPLRARVVRDGAPGDWIPIGTLVRLPRLAALQCQADAAQPCSLSGERLFLIAALSATPGFEQAAAVPEGYTGGTIAAPHSASGILYLKLRDAPDLVARAQVPAPPVPQSP